MGWIEGVSALKTGQTHLSEVLRCLWELCRVPKPRLSPSGARTVGRCKPQVFPSSAHECTEGWCSLLSHGCHPHCCHTWGCQGLCPFPSAIFTLLMLAQSWEGQAVPPVLVPGCAVTTHSAQETSHQWEDTDKRLTATFCNRGMHWLLFLPKGS